MMSEEEEKIIDKGVRSAGGLFTHVCHKASIEAGWWHDVDTGEALEYNTAEKHMLIVTEIAEATEGHRTDAMDKHLPHRKSEEVELADAVIRIFDLAGRKGFDLGGAIAEKLDYNAQRADHKPENRRLAGGKKY